MQQLMPISFFVSQVSSVAEMVEPINLDYFQQLSPPVQLLLDFEK